MDRQTIIAPQQGLQPQNDSNRKTGHLLSGHPSIKWIGIILGGAILFIAYLFITRTVFYNSDEASIVLEAQAMAHGNVLLRGWYISADHFLTIDTPFYALGFLAGLSMPWLERIVPSFLYVGVVVCSGYLIATSLQGKQRLWGLMALLSVLAFPSLYMVQKLMGTPVHIGTIFFMLVGLIAYRHFLSGAIGRWLAFSVVMLVMVLTLVGDPFVEVLFVLPVLLLEGLQMLLRRQISLQKNAVFFGTLVAIALSRGITWALSVVGVHILTNIEFAFANLSQITANLGFASKFVLDAFNANIFTMHAFSLASVPIFINAFVVLTFALVLIYSIVIKSRYFLWQANVAAEVRIMHVALLGTLGTLAAFILSTMGGPQTMRYILPVFLLSGLAALPVIFAIVNRNILKIAITLVFLANVIPFAYSLSQAPRAIPAETPALAVFKQHHLTQGLGSYWTAAFLTVFTRNQVVVHQIHLDAGKIEPDYFLADEQWFKAANLQQANFIVLRSTDNIPAYASAAVRSFGQFDHLYKAGNLTILVWDTPLLRHLQPGYSFG